MSNMDLHGMNLSGDGEEEEEEGQTWSSGVAIAVAVDKNKNSKYAVRWALDHLISIKEEPTLVLIHVRPRILTVPTPMGNQVPIAQVCEDAAALYIKEVESQTNELLQPYLRMCTSKKVQTEIRVLENENIPKAIVEHISNFKIRKVVLGLSSRNVITRKFMASDVPTAVAKMAPYFCTVYVVSKGRLSSLRSADFPTQSIGTRENLTNNHNLEDPNVRDSIFLLNGSEPKEKAELEALKPTFVHSRSSNHEGHQDVSIQNLVVMHSNTSEDKNANEDDSSLLSSNIDIISGASTNSYAETESEQTHLTNQRGISDFNKEGFPPKDIHIQEANGVEVAKKREEVASGIVSEEKVTYTEGTEAETETKERTLEYYIRITHSNVKGNVKHTLATGPQTYKRYSMEEIESATDFFSESLKIGEGSYGSVYKCTLDNTLVAIKVLCPEASQGWKQFQKEIEVLSHIRHPHMVMLLGACPEFGCLVYEYMENGSLEDRLFRRGATPSLPWPVRFAIASEVATGLLYLHSAKPKPLVHRDLKPANILLDHNFVSKIGDVGLAKLVPHDVSVRNTTTSGTFCYIDPEYQQTGILGTKSDLYALGVVLLQLLTAKKAMGLAYDVEKAINKGSFKQILDQTAKDWPVKEALQLAKLALKCVELRRRDRPDLETFVLPELQKLKESADSKHGRRRSKSFITSPSKILCPNLQVCAEGNTEEIVSLNINTTGCLTKNTFPKKLMHFYRKVF